MLFYFDDHVIREFLSTSKVSEVSGDVVPDHLKFGMVPVVAQFAESLINIYQNNKLVNKSFLNIKLLELLHLLSGLTPEHDFVNFLFRLTLPEKRNIKSFMEHNFDKPLKS